MRQLVMAESEVKIYTTFDSFDADQVIATLASYDIPSVKRIKGSGQYIRRKARTLGQAF